MGNINTISAYNGEITHKNSRQIKRIAPKIKPALNLIQITSLKIKDKLKQN